MSSDSYHLFYIRTRRQAVQQSHGWVCRVFDFFGVLQFTGSGRYRKDAIAKAKKFERNFLIEQKTLRERFKQRNSEVKAMWKKVKTCVVYYMRHYRSPY